jgi:hypothetical protein
MKKLRGFIQTFVFTLALSIPTFALAAGGPQAKILNVIDGLMDLLLIISPSLGALAWVVYAVQGYFSQDTHKKSETREAMYGVLKIVVYVCIGSVLIKWIVSLAS